MELSLFIHNSINKESIDTIHKSEIPHGLETCLPKDNILYKKLLKNMFKVVKKSRKMVKIYLKMYNNA